MLHFWQAIIVLVGMMMSPSPSVGYTAEISLVNFACGVSALFGSFCIALPFAPSFAGGVVCEEENRIALF